MEKLQRKYIFVFVLLSIVCLFAIGCIAYVLYSSPIKLYYDYSNKDAYHGTINHDLGKDVYALTVLALREHKKCQQMIKKYGEETMDRIVIIFPDNEDEPVRWFIRSEEATKKQEKLLKKIKELEELYR